MTYRELLQMLNKIPSERLDDTVTVHDTYGDEYIAAIDFIRNENSDVLDDGHYFLELKGWFYTATMIVADTPSAILAYRLLAFRSALKLESLGMTSSRGSVSNHVRKMCSSRTRDKKKLLAEYETLLKHHGFLKWTIHS